MSCLEGDLQIFSVTDHTSIMLCSWKFTVHQLYSYHSRRAQSKQRATVRPIRYQHSTYQLFDTYQGHVSLASEHNQFIVKSFTINYKQKSQKCTVVQQGNINFAWGIAKASSSSFFIESQWQAQVITITYNTYMYTLWTEKRWQYICDYNSGKTHSIFNNFCIAVSRKKRYKHMKNMSTSPK